MNIHANANLPTEVASTAAKLHQQTLTNASEGVDQGEEKLRDVFGQFVGEAFFGQMIKAMRSSLGKPAYFHGGRAEEVFQGQLDQQLSEEVSKAAADRFAEPMFQLFNLQRQS